MTENSLTYSSRAYARPPYWNAKIRSKNLINHTEEENSPIYQRQVKLNYDTNQQSESNEIPSFQLQISEKIIHRRSPPTLHHRLTIRMLKIGIEKIQEMNNHFHRNESYTLRASANLTTLPISEQNSILIDESVTHPKENLPYDPTSTYVVSNIPRLIPFNSKSRERSTDTGTQYSVGFNIQ